MLFFCYVLVAVAAIIATPVIQFQALTPTSTWVSLGGFETTSLIFSWLSCPSILHPSTCFSSGMPQDFDVPFHPRTVFTAWRDPSYAQPPHADVEPATKANVSSESHTDSASSPIPATSPVFDAYIDENGQHDAPHEEDLPPLVWDEMAEAPTPDDVPVLQSHDNIKESAGRAMRTAASKQFRTPAIRFRQLVQSEDWNHIVHLIFRPDTWRLFKVLLSLVTLPFVVTFGMFILGLIHEGDFTFGRAFATYPSQVYVQMTDAPNVWGARATPPRPKPVRVNDTATAAKTRADGESAPLASPARPRKPANDTAVTTKQQTSGSALLDSFTASRKPTSLTRASASLAADGDTHAEDLASSTMTITQEIYNNRSAATRTRTTAQLAASPLQSPADKKGKSKVTEKEPSTPQRDADEGYGGSQATSSAASATGSEVGENGPTMDGAAVTAKPISTSTPRNEKNKKKKKKSNQW